MTESVFEGVDRLRLLDRRVEHAGRAGQRRGVVVTRGRRQLRVLVRLTRLEVEPTGRVGRRGGELGAARGGRRVDRHLGECGRRPHAGQEQEHADAGQPRDREDPGPAERSPPGLAASHRFPGRPGLVLPLATSDVRPALRGRRPIAGRGGGRPTPALLRGHHPEPVPPDAWSDSGSWSSVPNVTVIAASSSSGMLRGSPVTSSPSTKTRSDASPSAQ